MSLKGTSIYVPLLSEDEAGEKAKAGLEEEGNQAEKVLCNVLFVKRFFRLLRIINAWPALILVALSIVHSLVVSQVGKITGKYYGIFLNGDKDQFLRLTLVTVGMYAATIVVTSTTNWLAEFLSLRWRKKLTQHLQNMYCSSKNFYYLKSVDNPDQRMAQDVSLFCSKLGQVAKVVATMPFGVVLYSYLTYTLTGSLAVLAAAYASFLGSVILLTVFIGPIAQLVFKQERFEGDLRMAFVRLRNRAQDIAILQGEKMELLNLNDKLRVLLKYQLKVVMWHWLLSACIETLDYWGSLLNYLCIGLVVFSGRFDGAENSGVVAEKVSNMSFYMLTLIYSFSQVQDISQKISDLVGLTPRISELLEAFDTNNSTQTENEEALHENVTDDCKDGSVRFVNLTCATPAGNKVVDNLSLELNAGDSLLVTGPNGCGKTTLMTVIVKLRAATQGRVDTCSPNHIMMLSQVPLPAPRLLLGDQITYPSPCSLDHSEVISLLEMVGLGDIWEKWVDGDLNQERDWEKILTPGELQRISIARVLNHRPSVAILDEATSSIPLHGAKAAYAALKARGITVISTSHNRELLKFHEHVLKLQGTGKWEVSDSRSVKW